MTANNHWLDDDYYYMLKHWSKKLNVPTSSAATYREQLLSGQFNARRRVKRGKEIFEIDFGGRI